MPRNHAAGPMIRNLGDREMALLNRLDALCAPASAPSRPQHESEAESIDLDDFAAEMKRLSAVNQELLDQVQSLEETPVGIETPPVDAEEMNLLRLENLELKERVQELEALAAGKGDDIWLERQREYEALLEEKSEVIRELHQKIQGQTQPSGTESDPSILSPATGQAEEILRLKRELDEQRRQLQQDEDDMMGQMRQMEIQMAKERAEMARHRQEVQRLQAELTREIENAARDPELKERLKGLRRLDSKNNLVALTDEKPASPSEQKSSSFFRRIFG